MSKHRSWCFTLNNYNEHEILQLQKWIESYCNYGIFGKEIAPDTGTPHLQGYLQRKSPGTLSALKRVSQRAHWEVAKGSADQNQEYCSKGGDVWTFGEYKGQGARTDLVSVKDNILSGVSVDSIVLDNPMLYHQYGRTLNKIEDLAMRRKFRTEMTRGIWYWGPTGVGKSHMAFDGFKPETHYVYPNDNGWWDGYTQQDIVILNDFRGEIPYGFLLQLVDKWPVSVKRRNREPLPFTSKTVVVTSSLRPEDVYHGVVSRDDNIAQLMRRFELIHLFGPGNGTEVVGGNTISPTIDMRASPAGHTVATLPRASPGYEVDEPTWVGIVRE